MLSHAWGRGRAFHRIGKCWSVEIAPLYSQWSHPTNATYSCDKSCDPIESNVLVFRAGPIPRELGKLAALKNLQLFENGLTGECWRRRVYMSAVLETFHASCSPSSDRQDLCLLRLCDIARRRRRPNQSSADVFRAVVEMCNLGSCSSLSMGQCCCV